MAVNTAPVFAGQAQVAWGTLTAANTATDGTGTVLTVFTAAATNGGRCDAIPALANGTNSSTSVARVFVNNGSTNATAGNNTLIGEVPLPITAASNSAPITPYPIDLLTEIGFAGGIDLPAGYKINVCIGTAAAGGWSFTGVAASNTAL